MSELWFNVPPTIRSYTEIHVGTRLKVSSERPDPKAGIDLTTP